MRHVLKQRTVNYGGGLWWRYNQCAILGCFRKSDDKNRFILLGDNKHVYPPICKFHAKLTFWNKGMPKFREVGKGEIFATSARWAHYRLRRRLS